MRSLKAVAIGGSNTVMRPGWLTELSGCLGAEGIDFSLSANLAVGNTTIQMGLLNLVEKTHLLDDADILLVEYVLNDTSTFSRTISGFETWVKFFEGVVRLAMTRNPSVVVLPIIFASRSGVHRNSINVLHAGVHYISSYYNLPVADINAALVRRFGRGVFETAGVYADHAHYQRPIFTRICAETVAAVISRVFAKTPRAHVIPDPIDPENYADAKVLNLASLDNAGALIFENRIYNEAALDLAGRSLEIDISGGHILAAKYVCTPDISRAYLESEGEWFEMNTMQPSMAEPKFKFLLSMLSFPKPVSDEGCRTFRLTGQRPSSETMLFKQNGARVPVRPEKSLPVSAILYSGKLLRAELVSARPDENVAA